MVRAIPLPGGGELVTLRDAGHYIAKLPSASTVRHAATEALLLVAEHGGDTMPDAHGCNWV